MSEDIYNDIKYLSNFKIHAQGHYVMITGITFSGNKYTFLASTSILKYILCDMKQKILIGSLSMCQLGCIFNALKSISCDYELVRFNDSVFITTKKRVKVFQRKRLINK